MLWSDIVATLHDEPAGHSLSLDLSFDPGWRSFGDSLLYWPHSHDGSRLALSVWNAGREMNSQRPGLPQPAGACQLADQVRKIRPSLMVVDDDVSGASAFAHLSPHRRDVILMDIHPP